MARINLRPWREEKRAKLQRDFIGYLVAAVIAGGALVFAWQFQVNGQIDAQQARNNYLKTATKELDEKIKQIQDLRERREELLARMQVIQDLQGKRPVIVRVFDEMVRTLPDGVFYLNLVKEQEKVDITGMAESNNRISALMRHFENSEWFAEPNLTNVAKADERRAGYSQFNMTVLQRTPGVDEAEDQP